MSTPEWTADRRIDEADVRHLLATQFPALRLESVRPLGEGWDNLVWAVDEEWAFRFPRRSIAVPLLEYEAAVLPHIAPRLPLPISAPIFIGRPAPAFPWPFVGARLLPGRELAAARLAEADRVRTAAVLGDFLRHLHAPALAEELNGSLRVDPNRRGDSASLATRTRPKLDDLAALGLWQPNDAAERWLELAMLLPPSDTRVLVHGDFHVRHVLVDEDGGPTGVIDWGDAGLADPALDLQIAWSAFSGEARAAFLENYGPVAEDQEVRARIVAMFLSALLALYAHAEGLVALEREALAGLDRAVR